MPARKIGTELASELGRTGARAKKVAAVEWRIRELIEFAPPLTDAQRDRLAALLRAPSDGPGATRNSWGAATRIPGM